MLRKHSGNEPAHICLGCGRISLRNHREAREPCLECGAPRVHPTFGLAGKSCPSCKAGRFDKGRMGAIS